MAATEADTQSVELLKQSLSLLLLENCDDRSTASMIKRGKAIALAFLVQLSLSKPYEAFDPSLAGEMEREALVYSVDHFYRPELRLRRAYSHLILSMNQKEECSVVEGAISKLECRKEAYSRLTSARPPDGSQYLSLREDVLDFVSHVGDESRFLELMSSIERVAVGGNAASMAQLWSDNADSFIKRMTAKYPCYRDIFGPLELSLRGMQYGVGLMASAKEMEGRLRGMSSDLETVLTALLEMPGSKCLPVENLDDILAITHCNIPPSSRKRAHAFR